MLQFNLYTNITFCEEYLYVYFKIYRILFIGLTLKLLSIYFFFILPIILWTHTVLKDLLSTINIELYIFFKSYFFKIQYFIIATLCYNNIFTYIYYKNLYNSQIFSKLITIFTSKYTKKIIQSVYRQFLFIYQNFTYCLNICDDDLASRNMKDSFIFLIKSVNLFFCCGTAVGGIITNSNFFWMCGAYQININQAQFKNYTATFSYYCTQVFLEYYFTFKYFPTLPQIYYTNLTPYLSTFFCNCVRYVWVIRTVYQMCCNDLI